MIDILDPTFRKNWLTEIRNNNENKRRKEESLKRFEVFRDKQRNQVLERLKTEFDARTVADMRTCTSINLTKRIVNEMASIYKRAPIRTFEEASENETAQLENLYEKSGANVAFKWANRYFKLQDQCAMLIVPSKGKMKIRVLQPHQYDVIPDPENPEEAAAYVISTFDRMEFDQRGLRDMRDGSKDKGRGDGANQGIGDEEDYKASLERHVWWSKDFHFVTDGNGIIQNLEEGEDVATQIANPIGRLPFVDIAGPKDSQFWVTGGNSVVEFALDFSVVISDTCNTNRLQSYAQPVISSEEPPEGVRVGPNNILWLKINPERPEVKPTFDFANPNPDMNASLELLDRLINYFLTANGLDPGTVSGTGSATRFQSGFERFLSMIEKFEASEDDIEVFETAEMEAFEIMRAWSNEFQDVRDTEPGAFMPDLRMASIRDEVFLSLQFQKPASIQSKEEKENSIIRRRENGLLSRVEAIMEDRGVDREEAEKIAAKIDKDDLQPPLPTAE